MAIVTLKGLGNISGRVGNIVFRRINGKTFISARAGSYKIPNTKEAIDRRLRFGITASLATSINKDELLKELWGKAKFKMTAYNAAFKVLYNYVGTDDISYFSMFPNYGAYVDFEVLENKKDRLKVSVKISERFSGKTPKYVRMITIFDCVDEYENKNKFFNFSSEVKEINWDANMEFELKYNVNEANISNIDCQKLEKCRIRKINIAYALLDENSDFVANSNTFRIEMN